MIARVWRGWASAADAQTYASHAIERVFPSMEAIQGYRGALLLRKDEASRVEFVVVTMWESLTAVRGFAGDQIDHAVIEPAALEVLAEFDTTVRHYDLVHRTMSREPSRAEAPSSSRSRD